MSGQMYFWQTHNGVFLSNLVYVHIHNHHFEYTLGNKCWWWKTLRKESSIGPPRNVSAPMSELRNEKGLCLKLKGRCSKHVLSCQLTFYSSTLQLAARWDWKGVDILDELKWIILFEILPLCKINQWF